jgi:phosphate transport system substrate-binding protein
MRVRKSLGMLLTAVIVLPLLGGTGHAAPAIGSPLVGDYCSRGGPIQGTGATFANNAHTQVFIPAYNAQCGKGTVAYASTGSGAGKVAARDRTHAFGGSDEPLTTDEWAGYIADLGDPTAPNPRARVSPLHHIPIALGAVTVSYNLTSCGIGQQALSLRSPVISAIFSGLITKWNDQLLTQENPALAACNKSISLAVRQDGSGTTYVFKDYLSKRNPEWDVYKQPQFNLSWPAEDLGLNTPIRGSGNGGVAAAVKANDGAIGYVEYSTAKKNGLTWAKVDGASLQFNSPADAGGAANCNEAATGAAHPASSLTPGWDSVSITDSANPTAYAICSITYALIYNNLATAFGGALSSAQAQTLVDYFGLALEDPVQAALNTHGYAALPVSLQAIGRAGLATVVYA